MVSFPGCSRIVPAGNAAVRAQQSGKSDRQQLRFCHERLSLPGEGPRRFLRRFLSVEVRENIAAAQRKRWAKQKSRRSWSREFPRVDLRWLELQELFPPFAHPAWPYARHRDNVLDPVPKRLAAMASRGALWRDADWRCGDHGLGAGCQSGPGRATSNGRHATEPYDFGHWSREAHPMRALAQRDRDFEHDVSARRPLTIE